MVEVSSCSAQCCYIHIATLLKELAVGPLTLDAGFFFTESDTISFGNPNLNVVTPHKHSDSQCLHSIKTTPLRSEVFRAEGTHIGSTESQS